jgi:hypothetical protein
MAEVSVNTVTFVITSFNEEDKQLDVSFDDGSYAKIQLKSPLPANQEDLEIIVKQFARPLEVVQAYAEDADLSFIHGLTEKQITTTRHSVDGMVPTPDGRLVPNNSNGPTPDAETRDQMQKNQEIQNKHGFAQMLVDLGVLKENPVDLSQIVDVTQKLADSVEQPIATGTITI